MVRLINKLTGGDMFVADDRVNEYLAAGHALAADAPAPFMNEPEATEEVKAEPEEDAPVKKYTTRRRKKV